ncbi:MAG: tRNA (adenosine(37)-N6)-threonylcarbamoyltransferase complex ATPase subunit type 1 TsaE [Desulfobacteraceae bacterium]|nr:MAG: tRNA (adenosine(37)-N6)-threonylcarbamoyltransferase complex ATPase subunit type 1 TsaE [Desulfobacteraceae bacterium]
MANFTIQSGSDEQTLELGRIVGALLKEGDVVALSGELGGGKTRFTKGIAEGLGIPPTVVVTSPSFALVNEYSGAVTLYHMDIYRLEDQREFYAAGLEEYLYGHGVAVMEWADRWPEILPDYSIRVRFEIVDDHRRNIIFSGSHPRAEEVIESFMKGVEET